MKPNRALVPALVLGLMVTLVTGLSVQLPQGAAHAQDPDPATAPEEITAPQAPLGTSFTYQGQLTDGGSPAEGEYDLRFRLYDAASTGNLLGTVTLPDQQVTAGLFTVQLDFGEVFTGTARFLQIGVRPGDSEGAYTTLSPRQELTPAPYALYAAAAPWSGLAGVPAGFADDVDDDTTYSPGFGLDLLGTTFHVVTSTVQQRVAGTCAVGSAIRVVNADGSVVCEQDDDTLFSAGFGLDLFGTTFHVVTSTVQQRVAGTCGLGSAIRVINPDGSVVCEPDDDSTAFWSLTGNAGTAPGTHLLGTVDGVGLVLAVSGTAALRLEPSGGNPSLIGGHESNWVGGGVVAATIAGGRENGIGDDCGFAAIGGGQHNEIGVDSDHTTVGGGEWNHIGSGSSWSSIGGGHGNSIGNDSGPGTIGGGWDNNIGEDSGFATIGGGWDNSIGDYSNNATISGGDENRIGYGSAWTSIGGGALNDIGDGSGPATIAGGWDNNIGEFSDCTTIGGGCDNTIGFYGGYTTIGGGSDNLISGTSTIYATIPGGQYNEAWGDYAFAAGRRAKANNDGCFIWGDSTDADVACNDDNRAVFRSSGGFYIYTNSGLTTGAYLSASGGSWNSLSDRNVKENFQPVDNQQLLARLAEIPITTWNYKAQDPAIRHVGPMAQDFNTLLPDLGGEGETHINMLDADGVALVAIQGLYEQNQELAAENDALRERVETLQEQNAGFEARLVALERGGVSRSPVLGLPAWLLLGGLILVGGVIVQRRRAW